MQVITKPAKLVTALLSLCGCLTVPAVAQNRTVWQIGAFNDSPVDLAPRHEGPVRFEVNKSDAAKDWPRSQQTGQSYQIVFNLPSVERGYVMKIGALIDRPRVPAVRLEINGHSGIFFL